MARRRNLSTEISDDRDLNDLAVTVGDFAALLFTWGVPHAQDDRSLPGEPDDLLYLVVPRRRDKTPADAETAIRAWVEAKLVDWVWVDSKRRIYYKAESFYRIQDKVPQARRFYGLPDGAVPVVSPERALLQVAADSPPSRQSAAESPQNAAAAAESPLARALPAGGPGSDPLLSPPDRDPLAGAASPPRRRLRRNPPPPPTEAEQATLDVLAEVEGYPFDPGLDLSMLRTLASEDELRRVDFGKVARDLRIAHLGNPAKPGRKSNPRLEFRHWCETEAKHAKNGAIHARASPPELPVVHIDPLTNPVRRRGIVPLWEQELPPEA